jgi:hypothetical protein
MLVFAPLPRCVTAAPYPGQDFALTPVDELPEGSEPDGSEPAEARTRKPLKLEPESVTVAVVPTMLAVSWVEALDAGLPWPTLVHELAPDELASHRATCSSSPSSSSSGGGGGGSRRSAAAIVLSRSAARRL